MARYDWVKKIDLARLSQRERFFILITATVLAAFLLFYAYLPMHRQAGTAAQTRDQLHREVTGLERQLDEVRETAKRLRGSKKSDPVQVGGVAGIRGRMKTAGPEHQRLSVILDELQRLAVATAVDFVSIRPQDLQEADGFWTQSITIAMRSTFKGIGKYLEMLESLPRILDIQNIQVEADPSQSAYVLVRLYMTVYLEKD